MKILIIRFSSIGDIVLTSPVVRCVKEQLKNVELHFLVKPQFKDAVWGNTSIDKVTSLRDNLLDTVKELRNEKFDFIIDLHHNQRTLLIKQALQAKSRSFDKQNLEKWLLVNFKVNRMKPLHIVDRYMETVKSLGVVNDGKGLDYFIPQSEEVDLNVLPESYRNGYFGWVIGAAHFTKKFPVHKIIAVCKKIIKPVVLLGGKNEFVAGEEISKSVPGLIFNACGKFSLNQSASLVKKADVIISNDTGLMHIAAAFKKPIISLWGNTVPEFGMSPYYGNSEKRDEIMEVKGLNCRPCSKIGYAACPKKHFKCMEMIDAEKIAALLQRPHL